MLLSGSQPGAHTLTTATSHIAVAQEPYSQALFDEFMPLMLAHYDEVNPFPNLPCLPNVFAYEQMASLGRLFIFTARQDGKLVGYAVCIVQPSLESAGSIQALCNLLYVDPTQRGTRLGRSLLEHCCRSLKGIADILHFHTTIKLDIGSWLVSNDLRLTSMIYSKELKPCARA